MFVDTHCHLSSADYDNIDEVIHDNLRNHVEKIIVSGCDRSSIEESVALSDMYPCVYVTLGFHPEFAENTANEDLELLENRIISSKKIVGIGEIGLDYHYGKEHIDKQKELFHAQLRLAEKYNLPVVIHSRDATLDTIMILKEYPNITGVIHCFSGSLETAKIYISLGYKLGIGGVVTFQNSNLPEVIQAISLDSIVLETDSPYLTPVPDRGKKNSSKYIPLIAEKIASIKGISTLEVADITTRVATDLFDLTK